MVKAAKDRTRCNSAESFDDAMERRVLDERSVSSEFVVIVGIRGQDPAQMRFAQDHDMIQAVASNRAD
jgi:phosphoribosylamine-glycine ligase